MFKNIFMKKNLILLSFALVHSVVFSQSQYKVTARVKKTIDSTYNALLIKHKVVGASIAIVDNGEIVYATGYGFADKEKQIKATENTIYRIGSCTKAFTALSVMQLQEKNVLNLNHSIKKYLTDLKITSRFNDNNEIYIKDLLSHVSGLPCDIANGFFCDAPPNITWVINELNKQTTISPRLYMHAYSNVGYGLLGELIARTNNTSYSNYVKENIFKPLNMTSSYIDLDEKLASNFSKGYLKSKELKEPMIRDQAAGLIHSNVLDMCNFIKMYLNNGSFNNTQIISSKGIMELEKNRMDSTLLSKDENWGYGLYTEKAMIKQNNDSSVVNIIGHGGDTYAYHADFAFIPELNIGVVLLTNTDSGQRIRSAKKLLKLYLKEAKASTTVLNYKKQRIDSNLNNEKIINENEIVGKYNAGSLAFEVKNVKKMKIKQGLATIVLKQKSNDHNIYTGKAVVLKVIPLKVKGIEFKFVNLNNNVYLKQIDTKTKEEMFAFVKSENNMPISNTWKVNFGEYKITNYYPCVNCPIGNQDGMTLTLNQENGILFVKTKGKTEDTNNKLYLNIISDTMAVSGGIGRGTGETVRVLENGNIYYSGFEFQKIYK